MNRGLAKRTMFEREADVRYFLSRLARAVRRGEIELHAYCVMTTHFHLMVRSLVGRLSESMRRVQNEYVRRFNRTRRRDGPLVRGRFGSRAIDSLAYRRGLVRYIDSNPVRAGLAARPEDFPHGSARHYANPSGPPWLERGWIEETVRERLCLPAYDPGAYGRCFDSLRTDAEWRVVERRTRLIRHEDDPVDDLLRRADGRTLAWMREKAKLADGTRPGLAVGDAVVVDGLVTHEREERGSWKLAGSRKALDGWHVVRVALLRDVCGLTFEEIGERTGRTRQDAFVSHSRHVRRMTEDTEYARRAAELAERAVMLTWEPAARSFGG